MADSLTTWCQPSDRPRRQFVVMFDDADRQMAVFDDEDAARTFWKQASLDWNCYLLGAMPQKPEIPDMEPKETPVFSENRKAVSELCGLHERLLRSIDDKVGFEMVWANDLAKIAATVLDAADRLDRANRQLQRAHYREHEIRHPSTNIVGAVWMAIMGCPYTETEDELTLKFDPEQRGGSTAGSQMTNRVVRVLEQFVIRSPSEVDRNEKVVAETLMRVAEELGLDHATAYNCIDAIRLLKASANHGRNRKSEETPDHKKGSPAVSAAEERLACQLDGIRWLASPLPVVREINNLIDAKIALATPSAAPEAPSKEEQYRDALLDLAVACAGSAEHVFGGEIAAAMSKARMILHVGFAGDEDSR